MILSGIGFSISGIAGVISVPLWGKYGQQRSFLFALYYAMAGAGFFMVMQYFASNLLTFSIFQFLLGTFIAGINQCYACDGERESFPFSYVWCNDFGTANWSSCWSFDRWGNWNVYGDSIYIYFCWRAFNYQQSVGVDTF
jgi:hypothetical protein